MSTKELHQMIWTENMVDMISDYLRDMYLMSNVYDQPSIPYISLQLST